MMRCEPDHNWSPDEAMMQVSSKRGRAGESYRPHYHIPKSVPDLPTGECWIIVRGKVKVSCYDLDESLLGWVILHPGDMVITFAGGHGYEFIEDSLVLEPKSGTYQGAKYDKVYNRRLPKTLS
jgi:hypothetical protein